LLSFSTPHARVVALRSPPPPRSPLFPYTTLFRSQRTIGAEQAFAGRQAGQRPGTQQVVQQIGNQPGVAKQRTQQFVGKQTVLAGQPTQHTAFTEQGFQQIADNALGTGEQGQQSSVSQQVADQARLAQQLVDQVSVSAQQIGQQFAQQRLITDQCVEQVPQYRTFGEHITEQSALAQESTQDP